MLFTILLVAPPPPAADPPTVWSISTAIIGYIIPPLLAALFSGYLVSRWKGRTDYMEKRLDELCEVILKTADLASEYWQADQGPNSAMSEAKIGAGNARIAGLRVMLESTLSQQSGAELRNAERAFFREATGGDYGVHNRRASSHRVISTEMSAAHFIVAVRAARMRDLAGMRQRQ